MCAPVQADGLDQVAQLVLCCQVVSMATALTETIAIAIQARYDFVFLPCHVFLFLV